MEHSQTGEQAARQLGRQAAMWTVRWGNLCLCSSRLIAATIDNTKSACKLIADFGKNTKI